MFCLSPFITKATLAAMLVASALSVAADAADDAAQPNAYKSVILIIGDGFDDQHVTMARNYLQGAPGALTLDSMPLRSAVQVETVNSAGKPLYVADSANTATTLASGVVTEIGRVGTDRNDQDVATILERASAKGFKTGVVSSASVTDATPAAFASHVANRGCENPDIIMGAERYGMPFKGCPEDALSNGGPGSIAEQLATGAVDVLLGGGRKHFDIDGVNGSGRSQAEKLGKSVVDNLSDLLAAEKGKPVIGLFAEGHLPVRLRGSDGRTAEAVSTSVLNKIDQRLGSATDPAPMDCVANPEFVSTPPLATLTEIALDRLSLNNERGIFLMVESASIDKQSHKRNPCGSIGEVEQLEEVLAVALTYAEIHPDTLIVVTADHAQAAQIVPEPSLFEKTPIPVYSPGKIARLNTPEGGIMRINYATNNFVSEEHTGANVPLFSNAAATGLIKPFMRQRDVHTAISTFLGLEPE